MTSTPVPTDEALPIIRGESEVVYDYGVPRSAPCATCLHPRRMHRRPWLALLLRRPLCRGLHAVEHHRTPPPAAWAPMTMPVLPCTCTQWRANR